MYIKNAVVATVLFFLSLAASSQEITSLDISSLQGVLRNFLDGKVRKTEAKVRKSSIDVMHRLQETERDMIASMNKKDSSFQKLTSEVNEFYSAQANALRQTGERLSNGQHYYTPLLDSIQGVLRFLNAESGLKGMVTPESGKLLSEYDAVQANVDRLTAIEKILNDRIGRIGDTYPKDLAERYTKKLHKLSNDYSSRIQKLKELYITPDKMISGAFSRFSRLEKFQDFMGKHSMLASFFRLPANGTRLEPQAIVGLQTRKSVEQLMASQLGVPGVSIEQQVGALFQRSESAMPQYDMDSLNLQGEVAKQRDSRKDQKHSAPGNQRKLGFGFNFQTTRYNGIFPVTVDFGFQVNYRISDKFYTGVGISYKLGLGNNFQSIKFTHEGVGFRSGLDFNIRKSFFISGGFEENYFKRISDFDQLKDFSQWQSSALLGAMQKVRIGRASSTIQLMYDFLHSKHAPRTQPVLFRFGYQF